MTAQPLWTVAAMADAMQAVRGGALPDAITGISIDSRTVAPGEAYFAIKGDVHDGHDFVEAALKNGAGLAVIAQSHRAKFDADLPLLVVPDVLSGLVDLARASRARSQAHIVAVTGSVGKTSTKEALRSVFSAQGETHASVASFNNHWGVPLSLARCPVSAQYAIFEIGMNHAGEIEPLVKLVRPHVAIITTVEPVHLEFFSRRSPMPRRRFSAASNPAAPRCSMPTTRNSPGWWRRPNAPASRASCRSAPTRPPRRG